MRAAILVALMVWGLGLGCDQPRAAGSAGTPPALAAAPAEAVPASAESTRAAPRAPGRPLPAHRGRGVDGRPLDVADFLGRRLLLFFFAPGERSSELAARALVAVAAESAAHNIAVLGVARAEAAQGAKFASEHGLRAPVLEDAGGAFGARLGLGTSTALLLVDGEGYVVRGTTNIPTEGPDPSAAVEAELREWLRLPDSGRPVPALGEHPLAPDFRAPRLDGGEPFESTSARGRGLVLIFFLHTCPHCHDALGALRSALESLPEAGRPALYGISLADRGGAVRDALVELGLDFFPVLFDPDGSIRAAYGAQSGVPVIYLIDAEGLIRARMDGWREVRDPPLLRMRLARLAGAPVPMLLHRTAYSGDEFCAVCHDTQHDTWLLTNHATAYDTLVRHAAESDAECVGCHVVGFGKPGGFSIEQPEPHLENVGCESCHGRGGPHVSKGFVKDHDYRALCIGCHDTKHSLGFDYASFLPRVSHAMNSGLRGLSLEEKRALLAERRRPRNDLLPAQAAYVGSEACRECHAAEFEKWAAQPHARALETLAARGKADAADCLRCHTTGFGRPGGFPAAGGGAAAHAPLAGVGCEACHGPGGDHVPEAAPKRDTIVALADKCDSCVILQICGGCHDDANDPGFEFAVQEKIERQRHGTTADGDRSARAAESTAHAHAPAAAPSEEDAAWTPR